MEFFFFFAEKKETENGMLQHTTRGLAQAGHYLVGKCLCNNKLSGSWQACGSPACAKPPKRCKQ
jgi:hypothetical protein